MSAIDITDGYYNIGIDEEDQHMLTCTWKGQGYVWTRAPFGINILVGLFQALMETVCEELMRELFIYLDDVIAYTIQKQHETWSDCIQRHCSKTGRCQQPTRKRGKGMM